MTRFLFILLALFILVGCIVQSQSNSFRVNLPAHVYSQKGWIYTCEVVSKPRVGGKMDCYLYQWVTPTQTPWVITATPLPAVTKTPTQMPTLATTPGTPYP